MQSIYKFRIVLLSFMLSCAMAVIGQNTTVHGVVKDASDGEPLIGVTIMVKGTTIGVLTDIDGRYSISSTPSSTLVFSYMGYKEQEVKVGNRSVIDVAMQTAINDLDEVVVIGYGVQRKSDITGSISSVSGKLVNDVPVSSALQAMQGKASGVNIIQNTGAPGGNTTVKIRGTGTINDADPLYVVDGFIVDNINHINPDDIANIEIFKDAASSAIYGARAANGVIAITTKSGEEGKTKISFDSYVGFSNPWKTIKVMGVEDYALMTDYINGLSNYSANGQLYHSVGTDGSLNYDAAKFHRLDTIRSNTPSNWLDAVSQTGIKQSYNLSVSGGNSKTKFMLSLGYYNESGIIKKSDYSRFNVRLNVNHAVTSWLTLNSNIAYVKEDRDAVPEGSGSILKQALYQNPLVYTYDTRGYWYTSHPLAVLNRYHERIDRDRLDMNVDLMAKFLKLFTYQFKASYYLVPETNDNFYEVNKLNEDFSMPTDLTQVYKRDDKTSKWEVNNLLTFNWNNENNNITMLVGQTAEGYKNSYHESTRKGANSNDADQWYLSSAYTGDKTYGLDSRWTAVGFIGRLNYNIRDRYLFQANIRADGSSKFSEANRWGYFPSVSVGWRFDNESFMQSLTWLTQGKLRLGWGKLGNNRIDELARYTYLTSQYNYPFGNGNHILYPGSTATRLGNDDIKWEKTESYNAGLDFAFFNNKLSASVEYFNKKTSDMLLEVPTVISAGLDYAPMTNAGSVRNSGWEVTINHRNNIGGFRYDLGVNFSFIKNKVLSLGTGNEPIYGAYLSEGSILDYVTKTAVGMPIGSFFGYVTDGIFQTDEEVKASAQYEVGKNSWEQTTQVGDFRFKDLNGDGKITAEDRTYLGSPLPKFVFGIPLSFGWKNWDLGMMFQGQTGNKIYNVMDYYLCNAADGNVYADIRSKHWSGQLSADRAFFPLNLDASIPDLDPNDVARNFRSSDFFVKDGSYLRLKELRVSYSLPKKLIAHWNLTNVVVSVSSYNLWTLTGYNGLDPEVGKVVGTESNNLSMGVDHGNYPQARSFIFGLKVNL